MATEGERLTQVEFNLNMFKTETLKAYSDMAMELLLVKGLTQDAIGRIAEVKTTLNVHTGILNEHTARFDRLEALLTQILARLPEQP